jgi:hypothetical protein
MPINVTLYYSLQVIIPRYRLAKRIIKAQIKAVDWAMKAQKEGPWLGVQEDFPENMTAKMKRTKQ